MNLSKLSLGLGIAALATAATSVVFPSEAAAYDCNSPDPAQWTPAAKPYFLIAFDTSGSMTSGVGSASSCGFGSTRFAHGKCAVNQAVQAFAGEVNFGLMTFPQVISGCNASCSTCAFGNVTGNVTQNGCGAEPGAVGDSSTRAGGFIRVPMLQDIGTPMSNVATLLSYVDGNCTGNIELIGNGFTPLNGILRDAFRYYAVQWVPPTPTPGGMTHVSPLTSVALGERACRPLNVILLTDGDETCDTAANSNDAAADLYNGFTKDGINWRVKTHVINFAGGNTTATNQLADFGDDGIDNNSAISYPANNEVQLATALSAIIAGSVAPETCNNVDDNCNGCVDEGYTHFCNSQPTCCAWTLLTDSNPAVPGERQWCLDNYTASIPGNPPLGNRDLLPCTTIAQAAVDTTGLCFNPGDICDEADNNCFNGIDEGATKCGMPLHCPQTEACSVVPAQDDDCDGVTDEGCLCSNPQAEVCDGVDNNCINGADEGIPPIACGFSPPANCAGFRTCVGGSYGPCSNSPQPEVCDGIDNDCDTTVDDNVIYTPATCVPPTHPGGLTYGGTSKCQLGTQVCVSGMTQCQGGVGPDLQEICDGIDNDCDGTVDESPVGAGQACGTNTPPCTTGLTVCVSGALVCQGGTQPQNEICDGTDNNCNGQTDESPLFDGPAPGFTGCWDLPGVACTHAGGPPGPVGDIFWSPPPGGSCTGLGSLSMPCSAGVLQCTGMGGWVCQGGNEPAPEVCDGVDNNCLNGIDDGTFPTEGNPCGVNAPPAFTTPPNPMPCTAGDCVAGTIQCTGGFLDCVNDVVGVAELCNGKDDNCDGECDEGAQVGGACTPPYDQVLYPGTRNFGPGFLCQLGILACDGMGGQICNNGVGPSPELCDGLDNDCDGTTDESGTAPDGLDGTPNPNPNPVANLGEVCGSAVGECQEGVWACVTGQFSCLQGQGPVPEECDCNDNDCNGVNDNPNTNNTPPLCGTGKQCVKSGQACQCAAPCGGGEFPCPGGQVCTMVTSSELGTPLGNYCLTDNCGDCSTKSTVDAQNNVLCAPEGTVLPNCEKAPECVCKGLPGCQAPCFGITCASPLVCTNYGPNAGECVVDNCFNLTCLGCDEACNDLGNCVPNPCTDTTCLPTEVCKPKDDFTAFDCLLSCAGVACGAGTVCKDGTCMPTCDPVCPVGEFCDESQSPPVCATDACAPGACPNGGCCDPATGACGSCPCEGVVCPDDQVCVDGECDPGAMGSGGGATTGSTSSTGVGGSAQTGAGGGVGGDDSGVFGLATGGGGCACSVPSGKNDAGFGWLGAGMALALVAARKRRRPHAGDGEGVSR